MAKRLYIHHGLWRYNLYIVERCYELFETWKLYRHVQIAFRAATIKLVHLLFIFWGNTIQKYFNCRIYLFNFVNWAYFSINTNRQSLKKIILFEIIFIFMCSFTFRVYKCISSEICLSIQLFQIVTSWAAETVLVGWHETVRARRMGMGFYKAASRRVPAVAVVIPCQRRRPAVLGGPRPQWPGHCHVDGSQMWFRRGRFRVPVLRLGVTLTCTLFFRKNQVYIINDL